MSQPRRISPLIRTFPKYNVSFEAWHELLMDYAELRGGSAADAEAWRDDYEAGKTPVEAYCDEWGDE
ncbi:hypothetical protein HMPREF9551_04903 [Escherichia coli MS 196-1]|nr:hypothetical protein [Escherichia coli]EFI86162.1 hypothetical protein HMPREF9551_04903 [Escherichia coli MS 196-1]